MKWIETEYVKRQSLVEDITQGASLRSVRGDLVWVVQNNDLIAFQINKKADNHWQYSMMEEENFTHDMNSCPLAYLDKTTVKNEQWRNHVCSLQEKRKTLKADISKAFKEAKSEGKDLVIEVDTETQGLYVLEVESTTPLAGRHKDGKLYKIPLRRIKVWRIQ